MSTDKTPDYTPTPGDEKRLRAMDVDDLLSVSVETNALFNGLETRKKLVQAILLDKLNEIGFQPGMAYVREADGVSASVQVRSGVDVIVKEKLFAKGVPADIIEFATKKGEPSKPFITVRVPKAKA